MGLISATEQTIVSRKQDKEEKKIRVCVLAACAGIGVVSICFVLLHSSCNERQARAVATRNHGRNRAKSPRTLVYYVPRLLSLLICYKYT